MSELRDEIEDRLRRNLARVDNLVAIYEQRAGARSGRSPVVDADLLRAAVVFLHATLEDLVRSVLAARWPHATDPDLFRRIPFVLPGDSRRPEKIGLGELAYHLQGKTVAEVVADAVEGHLAYASVNDRNERSGSGHHEVRSLRLAVVRRWRARVEVTCRMIVARM